MTIRKKFIYASFMVCWLLFLTLGGIVSAQSSPSITRSTSVIPDFLFQIPIGATTFIKGADITSGKAIAIYINTFYPWVVAFAAVLAVLAFTFAGVLWLTAGGDSGKTTESKKIMTNAVIGLVLALGSYTFLAALGKDYVNFKPITVKPITPINIDLQAANDELDKGVIGGGKDLNLISVPVTGCPTNPSITYKGKTYTKDMFGELWADVLCRATTSVFATSKSGEPQYDAGIDVHETIHGLNAGGSYYIGPGRELDIPESNKITLDMVVKNLPSSLQNGDRARFDIYLNTKYSGELNKKYDSKGNVTGTFSYAQQQANAAVEAVIDDFSAYNGNAKNFTEIYQKNLWAKDKDEAGHYWFGPTSFTAYSLALAQTLVDSDPNYLKNGNFKKNLKYMIEDGMKSYHDMVRINPSKIEPASQKMYDALRSSPDAQKLRDLAKNWYTAAWTQKWLGF